jgi:hypothetical protein
MSEMADEFIEHFAEAHRKKLDAQAARWYVN